MYAILLAPFYLLTNAYVFLWFRRFLITCHPKMQSKKVQIPFGILYGFFVLSLLIAFLWPKGAVERILKLIANYWYGFDLYILIFLLPVLLVRFIIIFVLKKNIPLLHSRKFVVCVGCVCLLGILTTGTYGMVHARQINTTRYNITVPKSGNKVPKLRVCLIADLHMGYNIGVTHIEKMVNKINATKPDLVVIAGDIFDNEYDALEDPDKLASLLKSIKSTYGTYACYGNHDIKEKILGGFTFNQSAKKESDTRMDALLKAANITLLQDESVLIDDSIYLYGRPDSERPGRGIVNRKSPAQLAKSCDLSKSLLVIDHEPRELAELAKAGVDVDLCGHTHDGQLFPLNIIDQIIWENSYGYLKKDKMTNIVTSGVGLFGPNMRVGSDAEIAIVDITFEK